MYLTLYRVMNVITSICHSSCAVYCQFQLYGVLAIV